MAFKKYRGQRRTNLKQRLKAASQATESAARSLGYAGHTAESAARAEANYVRAMAEESALRTQYAHATKNERKKK